LLQVSLERGEPVAVGGRETGSFGQLVDEGFRLFELRRSVEPD
jgi:hypothetical protein